MALGIPSGAACSLVLSLLTPSMAGPPLSSLTPLGLFTHTVLLDLLWDAAKTVQGSLQKVPAEFGGGIRMYRMIPLELGQLAAICVSKQKFYCFSKRDGFKSFIFLPVG